MKTFRFISTFAMLALATVVTAGSMYVTARAAAQQDSAEFDLTPPETAPALPKFAGDVSVPDVKAALEQFDAALDKSKILRSSQSHVILDANGGFNGRLSSLGKLDGQPVASANISLRLAQHGAIIGSATTDSNGRFSFTSMPEGVVAIWAEGENTLMLYSFVLFGHDTTLPENAALVTSQLELDMDLAVASGADVAAAKELIFAQMNSQDLRFSGDVTADDQQFPFGSGEISTVLQNRIVSLQNDGTLRGEIGLLDERTGRLREVLDLTVYFLRNGVRVASAAVANDGGFIANNLTPGVHSVVVAGKDGVMVSSVNIVGTTYEDNTIEDAAAGDFIPVLKVESSLNLAGGFAGCPVGPGNAGAFGGGSGGGSNGSNNLAALPAGSPVPGGGGYSGGGGGGFSGGGGGGGIGGGGGLGALLAGGIGGAIGYLVGQNDDPASPGI